MREIDKGFFDGDPIWWPRLEPGDNPPFPRDLFGGGGGGK